MGVTVQGTLIGQWRDGRRKGDAIVMLDDGRTVEVTPSGPRADRLPAGSAVLIELDTHGRPSDWRPALVHLAA